MRGARTEMIERMYLYDLVSNQAILMAKGGEYGWAAFGDRADMNMFFSKTINGKYIVCTEDMLVEGVEIMTHEGT